MSLYGDPTWRAVENDRLEELGLQLELWMVLDVSGNDSSNCNRGDGGGEYFDSHDGGEGSCYGSGGYGGGDGGSGGSSNSDGYDGEYGGVGGARETE